MVRRDKNIPWEVIIRKFKCEISEKEQAELDVWLADVENHARFQSWQSLWLSIMEENMRYVSNVDALWKRMEERMRKAEPRMFKLSLRSFRLYIAAVAVLFFLLFSFAGYMGRMVQGKRCRIGLFFLEWKIPDMFAGQYFRLAECRIDVRIFCFPLD